MKVIALVLLVAVLAACSPPPQRVVVRTEPVPVEIAQPASPRPVNLVDVKFRVVTAETIDSFIEEMKKTQENNNPVFVAISIKDYQSLTLNLAELRRYIKQQNSVIVYYRKATS